MRDKFHYTMPLGERKRKLNTYESAHMDAMNKVKRILTDNTRPGVIKG